MPPDYLWQAIEQYPGGYGMSDCGLVWLLDSRWPDLIIGVLIALVILRGALHIIADARRELAAVNCGAGCQD